MPRPLQWPGPLLLPVTAFTTKRHLSQFSLPAFSLNFIQIFCSSLEDKGYNTSNDNILNMLTIRCYKLRLIIVSMSEKV